MTILFASGELAGLTPSDGNTIENTSLSPVVRYDAAYARCSVETANQSSYAFTLPLGSQTTLWTHFNIVYNGTGSVGLSRVIQWVNSSGVVVIRARSPDSATLFFDYWNGAALVTMPAITVDIQHGFQVVDVKIVCGSKIQVYIAGTLRFDSVTNGGVATMPAVDNVDVIQSGFSGDASLSQLIVTNSEPTIGWRLFTRYPTGNGANTAWTGDYTNVDEIVYSDADYISSGTATQVETYTGNSLSVTSYAVKAVVVTARAKCDSTGPQNLQLAVRTSATNYFSSTKALDVGYAGFCGVFATNPNTSAAWTVSDASAAEFGIKSIA